MHRNLGRRAVRLCGHGFWTARSRHLGTAARPEGVPHPFDPHALGSRWRDGILPEGDVPHPGRRDVVLHRPKGSVEFHQHKIYEKFKLGPLSITAFTLDHPGGCFGYRVEQGGHSVNVAVDGEFKRRTAKELGKDLPYFQNLDLLIFDSQYDRVELESRFDWGHCTPIIGTELALREGVRTIAFVHHDPWAAPHKLRSMLQEAGDFLAANSPEYAEAWKARGAAGPKLVMGYDGLVLNLDKL